MSTFAVLEKARRVGWVRADSFCAEVVGPPAPENVFCTFELKEFLVQKQRKDKLKTWQKLYVVTCVIFQHARVWNILASSLTLVSINIILVALPK